MYAEVYLKPSQTSIVERLCNNLKKKFFVDARLGSKYTSCIGFTEENVYRISMFIWYSQSQLQKFVIAFLFSKLIKKYVGLTKKV